MISPTRPTTACFPNGSDELIQFNKYLKQTCVFV